jgi:putative DNA primase/helicase
MVKKTGGIPNDLAGLKGARMVSAQEVESGQRLAESLVKQVTGGGVISARFLHGEFFEFRPSFKLWIDGNSKPVIRGGDHAIWRRIRLIPFTVQIPPEQQDRRLSEKLKGELPGILNWALSGCLAWQKEGLTPPDEVKAATENYRDEMDIIGQFISERCLIGPCYHATAKSLYSAFSEWSGAQGEKRPMIQQNFGMRLTERGLEKRRGTGGFYSWYGIGLIE